MYIKHSFQKKQEIIKLYQEGFGSNIIASRFNISKSHVKNLIKRFKYHGEEGLKRLAHPKVTGDFKSNVVKQVLEKGLSLRDASLKYGIGRTIVTFWVKHVRLHGYSSLFETKPRGKPLKNMGRPRKKVPQTELEILLGKVERLETENALLKKVKALVEKRESQMHVIGQNPSKN